MGTGDSIKNNADDGIVHSGEGWAALPVCGRSRRCYGCWHGGQQSKTAEKSCINWLAKFQLPVQLERETGKILKITSVGE